jgi:hypothetical protein
MPALRMGGYLGGGTCALTGDGLAYGYNVRNLLALGARPRAPRRRPTRGELSTPVHRVVVDSEGVDVDLHLLRGEASTSSCVERNDGRNGRRERDKISLAGYT